VLTGFTTAQQLDASLGFLPFAPISGKARPRTQLLALALLRRDAPTVLRTSRRLVGIISGKNCHFPASLGHLTLSNFKKH